MQSKTYTFAYFQTTIKITLGENQESLDKNTLDKVDKLLRQQQNKWLIKNTGQLKNLNTNLASGKSFTADNETIEVIKLLQKFYKTSQEYFNPTLGKLINYWSKQSKSSESSLNISDYLSKLPKPDDIKINGQTITSTNPNLQLNINGIITAHVLLKVRDILLNAHVKSATIAMGNDLYVIISDSEYKVVAKKTTSKKMPQVYLKVLNNEFLSTSGIFIKDFNNIVRTIVNPKTGKPAKGFYGSVVIDEDAYKANVASIALIIAGPTDYERVAESLGVKKYLLYTYDQQLIMSEEMRKSISKHIS